MGGWFKLAVHRADETCCPHFYRAAHAVCAVRYSRSAQIVSAEPVAFLFCLHPVLFFGDHCEAGSCQPAATIFCGLLVNRSYLLRAGASGPERNIPPIIRTGL